MRREGEQQHFVASEVLKNAGQESRLFRSGAKTHRIEARQRQKAAETSGIGGQKRDRRDGKGFGLLPPVAICGSGSASGRDRSLIHRTPVSDIKRQKGT